MAKIEPVVDLHRTESSFRCAQSSGNINRFAGTAQQARIESIAKQLVKQLCDRCQAQILC